MEQLNLKFQGNRQKLIWLNPGKRKILWSLWKNVQGGSCPSIFSLNKLINFIRIYAKSIK